MNDLVKEWVMAAVRDVAPDDPANFREDLVDAKAWDLLGMTGQEFRRRWYDGEFRTSNRPEVVALDVLMRTGVWSQQICHPSVLDNPTDR